MVVFVFLLVSIFFGIQSYPSYFLLLKFSKWRNDLPNTKYTANSVLHLMVERSVRLMVVFVWFFLVFSLTYHIYFSQDSFSINMFVSVLRNFLFFDLLTLFLRHPFLYILRIFNTVFKATLQDAQLLRILKTWV